MKITEIISEGKRRGSLRKATKMALPDMQTYEYLDNNNHPYMAYRFGIALAVSPDTHMNAEGPIGSKFTTIGYSDADEEIINAAKKLIGVKANQRSNKRSSELPIVNTTSTTAPKKKNKYGV